MHPPQNGCLFMIDNSGATSNPIKSYSKFLFYFTYIIFLTHETQKKIPQHVIAMWVRKQYKQHTEQVTASEGAVRCKQGEVDW